MKYRIAYFSKLPFGYIYNTIEEAEKAEKALIYKIEEARKWNKEGKELVLDVKDFFSIVEVEEDDDQ